jgi:hypothetical protein
MIWNRFTFSFSRIPDKRIVRNGCVYNKRTITVTGTCKASQPNSLSVPKAPIHPKINNGRIFFLVNRCLRQTITGTIKIAAITNGNIDISTMESHRLENICQPKMIKPEKTAAMIIQEYPLCNFIIHIIL